jgi:hypothetical protein
MLRGMARLVICVAGVIVAGLLSACGPSSTTPKIVFKHGELRGRLA